MCSNPPRVIGKRPKNNCRPKGCHTTFTYNKTCCVPQLEEEWIDFPFVIVDQTPQTLELPATAETVARYYVDGKTLHLQYSYFSIDAAASAGTGIYDIQLPSGFTYDGQILAVGSAYGDIFDGSLHVGSVVNTDSNVLHVILSRGDQASLGNWGASHFLEIGQAGVRVTFNATMRIL